MKVAVAGGFGVGKTTFVRAISEITPLRTEAEMTAAGTRTDDIAATPDKTTTTVAFDFGRITLSPSLVMYLFGAPGQERFEFLWSQLFAGAVGVVVLLDTRRLDDCFRSLDRAEAAGLPLVLAHNVFGDQDTQFTLPEIRDALRVADSVPLVRCDARDRHSVHNVLLALAEHATARAAAADPREAGV